MKSQSVIVSKFDAQKFLSEAPNLHTLPTSTLREVQGLLGQSQSEEALFWRIHHILSNRNLKQEIYKKGTVGGVKIA